MTVTRERTPMEIFAIASMTQSVSINLLMQEHTKHHDEGERAYYRGDRRLNNPYTVGFMPWAAWEMGYRAAEARDK